MDLTGVGDGILGMELAGAGDLDGILGTDLDGVGTVGMVMVGVGMVTMATMFPIIMAQEVVMVIIITEVEE